MAEIVAFFSNTIVIGVISSLIASIIIFFVSKFVFRRKINKEKAQRISMARKDVIYAIRPMILEKRLIPSSQLSLFLSSLAKQYEVDAIDIYDYQGLSEDLIKEILLNPLLSIDNRVEYWNVIETFLKSGLEKDSIISKEISSTLNPPIHRLSIVLSIIAAILTLILTLLSSREEIKMAEDNNVDGMRLPIAILSATIIVLVVFFFLKKIDVTKVVSEIIEDKENDDLRKKK